MQMSKKYIITENDVVDNVTSSTTDRPLSAQQGKILSDTLSGHTNNTENPHNVTAAQIGEATYNTLGCVKISNERVNLYVNANTGDDSNDGLTASTAFKTINHAIEVLPLKGKNFTQINVAEGEYTEPKLAIYPDLKLVFKGNVKLTKVGGGGYSLPRCLTLF